jgi:hypothetical protein
MGTSAIGLRAWVSGAWPQLRRRWTRRWSWAAGAVAAVLVLYLLAGFFLIPGLIRSQATAWVRTNLDKSIAIGTVRFNPITFAVDLTDLALPGSPDPIVSVGHLRVRFDVFSLFGSAYGFNEIRIDRPYVNAVVDRDGSLNLVELLPHKKSKEPSPDVWIGTFSVNQGRVAFYDASRPQGLKRTLLPLTFTLKDFQTNRAEGGGFAFNASSEKGERFNWTGTLSIAPIASAGNLVVSKLSSDTVQRAAGNALPVALTSGSISFRANYQFSYDKGEALLNLALPDLSLANIALEPRAAIFNGKVGFDRLSASISRLALVESRGVFTKLRAALPRLAVRGIRIARPGAKSADEIQIGDLVLTRADLDYGGRKVALGALTVTGAGLPIHRSHDGKLDLLALLPVQASRPATPVTLEPAWRLSLGQLALVNSAVHLDDDAVAPSTHVAITELNASATNLGTDLSQPSNVRFDARVNGTASVAGNGVLTPNPGVADLSLTVGGLPLTPLLGYVPHSPDLVLPSGNASLSGTLHFDSKLPSATRFAGDASIANFDLRERTTNSSLFAWHSFDLKGIDYKSNRAEIARGTLARPFGRIAVLPNRTFNFMALMNPGATPTATPAPLKASSPKPSVLFTLKRLDIGRGTMSFADYSIQPNFNARIEALEGSITNLSDAPRVISAIDLKGHVIDRYSPVTIKGTMNLLGYDRDTNLHLAFRNIELPIFNPYSGRYAGYAIAKGKLTTELTYTIQNRALKADHHIIVDQLEWGQATATKEAVPFPVRLATALLKDVNGVIDLDVPVTGSLDDPQFRLGPIIWQVIGNILEKAVTAPFRLIGSLFAGADKAQYIDFAPGSAALPAGSADALSALAKALIQRPALKLDIPAGPGIGTDADGAADAKIDALLMADEVKDGKPADVTTLDADQLHDRLSSLYRERFKKRPEYPAFSPNALKAVPAGKADLTDDDRRTILEGQWLRDQLRPKFAPSPAELEALGKERATAIRNALLANNTTIDAARIFMAAEMTAAPSGGHSRVELKFE